METLEIDVKKYDEIHLSNGYKLATTADSFTPWFLCTLRCRCEKIHPMSEMDKIFCMCVEKDIRSYDDISFVLSLDKEICIGEIERLISGGILSDSEDGIQFTDFGVSSYSKKIKTETEITEYPIAVNAITGSWKLDCEGFLSDKALAADAGIKLSPCKTVVRDDIENNDEIRQALCDKYETSVIRFELLDYKTVSYQGEHILFYTNDDGHILFEVFDDEREELDIDLVKSLRDRYEKREILELMQAEKHIEGVKRKLLDTVKKEHPLAAIKPAKTNLRYMRNQEIRELFLNEMDEVEEHIFIISPWITDFVVDEDMVERFESILKRGVHVEIGFGYVSMEKMEWKLGRYQKDESNINSEKEKKKFIERRDKDKELQSWNMALMLKDRFKAYKNFDIFYVNEGTHEKVFCYDDAHIFVGSFNLLSYDGGETENYSGFKFRYEGGVLIEDKSFAESVMKDFQASKRPM